MGRLGAQESPTAGAHLLIVSSSSYFHNYRHTANALALRCAAREQRVPDSRIVLMLAGEQACDARNAAAGAMRHATDVKLDLLPCDARVEYRGDEVTVETFLRVLTDRVEPGTPLSRRLTTGPDSDVVLYLTGHGGDNFFKFRDLEELTSSELAAALAHMQAQRRFGRMLVMLDTCQAATMAEEFSAFGLRNVIVVAASARGENSLSRQIDPQLGVAVADRFTYHLHAFLRGRQALDSSSALAKPAARTLRQLVDSLPRTRLLSTLVWSQHSWGGDVEGLSTSTGLSRLRERVPIGRDIDVAESLEQKGRGGLRGMARLVAGMRCLVPTGAELVVDQGLRAIGFCASHEAYHSPAGWDSGIRANTAPHLADLDVGAFFSAPAKLFKRVDEPDARCARDSNFYSSASFTSGINAPTGDASQTLEPNHFAALAEWRQASVAAIYPFAKLSISSPSPCDTCCLPIWSAAGCSHKCGKISRGCEVLSAATAVLAIGLVPLVAMSALLAVSARFTQQSKRVTPWRRRSRDQGAQE